MNTFAIELFKSFELVNFYTIRFFDEEVSETDKFILKYQDSEDHVKSLQIILESIARMGNITGAPIRKFRPEKKGNALPSNLDSSSLRLYCKRINDNIVILGNGGHKTAATAQEGEFTAVPFDDINTLAGLVDYRRKIGTIKFEGKQITGNLTFKGRPNE